jgi:hypothetical protein
MDTRLSGWITYVHEGIEDVVLPNILMMYELDDVSIIEGSMNLANRQMKRQIPDAEISLRSQCYKAEEEITYTSWCKRCS